MGMMLKTVVVVDDEPSVVSVLQEMLEDRGYKVVTASSAADGLRCLLRSECSPALVLADFAMPGMNGAEMAEAMRAAGYADLPIVLVSAFPRAATPAQVRLFAEVLQKPVRFSKLMEVVDALIGPP